jgi:hypothetical protein
MESVMHLKDRGHFVARIIVPQLGVNEISCEGSDFVDIRFEVRGNLI